MMQGTCVCGASTGCDGMHTCPTNSMGPIYLGMIEKKDAELTALRARLAEVEGALKDALAGRDEQGRYEGYLVMKRRMKEQTSRALAAESRVAVLDAEVKRMGGQINANFVALTEWAQGQPVEVRRSLAAVIFAGTPEAYEKARAALAPRKE